jgi:hypothetical protein
VIREGAPGGKKREVWILLLFLTGNSKVVIIILPRDELFERALNKQSQLNPTNPAAVRQRVWDGLAASQAMTTGLYTSNTELQPTAEIIKRTTSLSKAKKRWVWCSRWRWKFGALIRLLGPVREGLLSGCFSRFPILPPREHDTLTMQLKLSPRVKAADMARTSGSQVPSIRELQMRSIIRSPVALVKVNNNLKRHSAAEFSPWYGDCNASLRGSHLKSPFTSVAGTQAA